MKNIKIYLKNDDNYFNNRIYVMSFKYDKAQLHKKDKDIIKSLCVARPKITQYEISPQPVYMFKVVKENNEVILPVGMYRYLAHISLETSSAHGSKETLMDIFPNENCGIHINVKFTGELYSKKRDQDVVMNEALNKLKEHYSVLLALHTGYGKTICGAYAIAKLGLKTMILCKQTELHIQWIETLKNFTNANVQIIKDSALTMELDPKYDVYIMGIQKAGKASPETFKDIGLLIIDEVHVVFAESCSKALLNFFPKYLIGLSATPDRKDGLDKLFQAYFGKKDEYIVRTEVKNFTVIKYNTGFEPEITTNYRGILDWSVVLNSLAYDPNRQKLIVKIAQSYPNEKILMLSRRIDEIKGVVELLKQSGENVATLYGSQKRKQMSPDFRILVASEAKAGVGFDDSSLTMLILLTDSTDVRQFEGRIRQSNNIVIDLVDNFSVFENHWLKRESWYLQRGATIKVKGYLKDVRSTAFGDTLNKKLLHKN